MATEIIREFDGNFAIPEGLKNAVEKDILDEDEILVSEDDVDIDADIDIQHETLEDEDSELYEDEIDDGVVAPDTINIVSQTVRTAPDGRQVVDVIIEVDEVEGASKYDVRISKA